MCLKTITLIGTAICGLSAQNAWTPLTATIPFDFDATGVKLQGGRYEVLRSGYGSIFGLRSKSSGKTILLPSGAANENKHNRNSLEFRRYGDSYFLSAIESRSLGQKISIPTSRSAKEMAITTQPETIFAAAE